MLFEKASSKLDSSRVSSLKEDLKKFKRTLFESEELETLTKKLGYEPNKTDEPNAEDHQPPTEEEIVPDTPENQNPANKAVTTIKLNRPQQVPANPLVPITPTTAMLPPMNPNVQPNSVNTQPASDVVVVNLAPDQLGKKVAVTSQGKPVQVGTLNDEMSTDPMDTLNIHQPVSEETYSILDNNLDMNVPEEDLDTMASIKEDFASAIANAAPGLQKGTIVVKQPEQLRDKRAPRPRAQSDIVVLPPENDPNGTSVAGLDNDLALRFL